MLAFLHTAEVHVATFENLVREIGAGVPARHEVDERLLAEAVSAGGIGPELRRRIDERVQALVGAGARVVVTTCSTIGAAVEETPVPAPALAMRIDRPMAEQAVRSGARIVVAAALESTFGPTLALLARVAQSAGRAAAIDELFCAGAWAHFERGDRSRYALEIAKAIEGAARPGDVVVLAQASMAPAAELLGHLAVPILSSPRLGVEAAVAAYRERS